MTNVLFSDTLFADCYQFYFQDEAASGDLSDAWTPQATEDLLAVGTGVIVVGTARIATGRMAAEIKVGWPRPGSP